jgi:hypothetical protein
MDPRDHCGYNKFLLLDPILKQISSHSHFNNILLTVSWFPKSFVAMRFSNQNCECISCFPCKLSIKYKLLRCTIMLGGVAVVWEWWENSHVPGRSSKPLLQWGESCRSFSRASWTPKHNLMDGHLSLQDWSTVWSEFCCVKCMDSFQTQDICSVPF